MKKSLNDQLKDLQPKPPSLIPQELPGLVKSDYTLSLNCTEKQLTHVKSHLRMLRIKFEVINESS